MAQSAMANNLIGVTLFWDKGPQSNMVWEKWFSTAKLAIFTKESIQLDKLLSPRPTSSKLGYPQEPIYEPPTSDDTAAEKRQREQQNKKLSRLTKLVPNSRRQ